MKLVSSLLLSTTAALAVVSAQAADLPSRKAAPASYVKICDAYGAGFFFIPGTDTCLKVGGYVRVQADYTPAQNIYVYGTGLNGSGVNTTTANPPTTSGSIPANNVTTVAAFASPAQLSGALNTTGYEVRGRIDVDARTPTALGAARTYIRLRGANTSGARNDPTANNAVQTPAVASTTALTIESAMIQWAGFTFGVAPENYGFMPATNYGSNPWTGFPNGMKQLAYTASFGGGFSATIALEDHNDMNNSGGTGNFTYLSRLDTAYLLVGNVRLDQNWGFAVLHGMIGNNGYRDDYATNPSFGASPLGALATYSALAGQSTESAYAIGGTAQIKLPMLAPGDALYLTANYTKGILGALLSTGGLSDGGSSASDHRFLGGIVRVDQNIVPTGGLGTAASPYTVGSTTGWNLAGELVHYWGPQWRSWFTAGYVEINPPTSTLTEWGKGREYNLQAALVYSPAKDFDIGLELQYLNLKSNIQNAAANYIAAGSPGLSESGVAAKLRIERTF